MILCFCFFLWPVGLTQDSVVLIWNAAEGGTEVIDDRLKEELECLSSVLEVSGITLSTDGILKIVYICEFGTAEFGSRITKAVT